MKEEALARAKERAGEYEGIDKYTKGMDFSKQEDPLSKQDDPSNNSYEHAYN